MILDELKSELIQKYVILNEILIYFCNPEIIIFNLSLWILGGCDDLYTTNEKAEALINTLTHYDHRITFNCIKPII